MSVALFNPHSSPPDLSFFSPFADEETAAQRSDVTCLKPKQVRGMGFSTPSCWRRFHSCGPWSWAKSGPWAPSNGLYKPSIAPLPLSLPHHAKPLPVSSSPTDTPLLLSQWGTLCPTPGRKSLQGDFSMATPLQPVNPL